MGEVFNLPEPMVTKQQLAGHLQLSVSTIDRWIARGLPHYKPDQRKPSAIRFRISEVEDWLYPVSDGAA